MSELRVPMLAFAAQVVCADGRELRGRLFVPSRASRHSGPMRAQEWLNESPPFFPFERDDGAGSVLLNKREIVVITMDATADEGDVTAGVEVPLRYVKLECGARRLLGTVAIDMPPNQCRLVDHLNRDELFLTLRDGEKHHLVQKHWITQVIEAEAPEKEEK